MFGNSFLRWDLLDTGLPNKFFWRRLDGRSIIFFLTIKIWSITLYVVYSYSKLITMTTTENLVGKTVKMNLVGLDGNAFSLMGAFSSNAKRQGWTKDEIDVVLQKCMSDDYDNLIHTLVVHTEEIDEDNEW